MENFNKGGALAVDLSQLKRIHRLNEESKPNLSPNKSEVNDLSPSGRHPNDVALETALARIRDLEARLGLNKAPDEKPRQKNRKNESKIKTLWADTAAKIKQ